MSYTFKKIVAGSFLLTMGQGCAQFFSLLRNAIFGHFLSPEDFGMAATFAFTISAIEMASDMGADKLLVQSKDGNDKELQGTAHFYNVSRGLVGAGLVFLLAPYIIRSFGLKDVDWAFDILSAVIIIRGFVHLDMKRFQREMHYTPFVMVELVSQALAAILAYPLVIYYRNYDAIIYLILFHALFYLLMSHFYSKRRYRVNISLYYLKRIIGFGWPLIFNGVLMYIIMQGDKLVVGSKYSVYDLGIYSAAFMVSMVPALLVVKTVTSVILPLLSKQQSDNSKLDLYYSVITEVVIFIAFFYSVTYILFGDYILTTIFGKQYYGYDRLIGALGVMWSLRIIRVPSTLLAMAKGNTQVALIANCFRALALGGVFLLANKGYSIEYIAYCGCVGEAFAVLISVFQIKYKFKIKLLGFSVRYVLYLLMVLLSVYLFIVLKNEFYLWHEMIFYISSIITMFFILLFFSSYKELIKKEELIVK